VSGGAFAWYSDRHAADRRQEQAVAAAKARQVVETALDQAEAALKAEKMPEADAALAVAEQRLADADAKDLRDRFEDVRKDPDMVRELDDIAEQRWAVHDERQRWAGTNPKIGEWFDEAFRRYGLAVGECDPADTAARIRSSRVTAALVAGLNEWFFLVPKQPGVLAVLDRADPDSVRVELRAAVAAGQEDRVRELTTNLDAATLTPGFAVALGMHPALSDEEGYKLLRAAWDAHPDSFGLALRIGSRLSEMAQTMTGDREHALEAVAWNRTAIALRPRSAVAHSNLGAALSRNGDLDGAIAACREAIRLDPKFTLARNNLGVTLCQKGDMAGASKEGREAIRLDPKNASAHYHLGVTLYQKGDMAGAIKEGREAIRLDPKNASAHYHLGNALDEIGDHDGAVVQYREAIRLDPKNAPAHNNLGFALSRKGDLDKAVVEYREAIRLDPKSFMAHNGLAWLLATGSDRVRNGKLSVDHATKACDLSGWKDPSPLDTLAAASAEAGEFDKAVEYEKKALAVPGIDRGLQRELKKRLALFEQRRPYRDPAIARPELGPPPREVK
jgi:Flp pilus assembly protein TadD